MNKTIKDDLELEATKIREYIAFNGSGNTDDSDQAKMQSIGVAALWHRIQESDFAYLADEVGMGKTRQAMGVIALQFLKKPDSRVVIICPGKPLQEQWKSEWDIFVSKCLRINDGILKSALDERVKQPLALHDRLAEFASSLLLDKDRLHLLRYSSFSRPIGFNGKETVEEIEKFYKKKLKEIGIFDINADERHIINSSILADEHWKKHLTAKLNTQYAQRIQKLFNEDTRPIDLIVCDEAQYLRHTGNSRNSHIKLSLASKPKKWLFLSATPLHGGQCDIKSLDHYICSHGRDKDTHECAHGSCVNIQARMEGTIQGQKQTDIIDILDEFLVRRPRYYIDDKKEEYDKVNYRHYKKDAAVATNDAFSSMVTALVQKRLVKSLNGKNNQFRQGECSSFESLASSVKSLVHKDVDGNSHTKSEMESSGNTSSADAPPDRDDINQLNHSLRQVLVVNGLENKKSAELKNLPHPKLYHVVDQLVENCLKNAPNHKTLVFVRRLATVDELICLLKQRFQKLIDNRIDQWPSIIKALQVGNNKHRLLGASYFWEINDADDAIEVIDSEVQDVDVNFEEPDLSYYQAIRKKNDKKEHNGMLYSLLTRLLQPTSSDGKRKSPLAFLVPSKDEVNEHWVDKQWKNLLDVIFDQGDDQPAKLTQSKYSDDILVLKRCILQSIRRSDFIVDLYILNKFTTVESHNTLSDKLIWIFEQSKNGNLKSISPELHEYFNNWRNRLKQWCIHFELIKSKCFSSDASGIDAQFSRMGPVVGRSGDISNKYAVTQFKMPCYPNILICTDVLKEGVDMHLFCDEVIHYGVAWTSGDLEQRIGRVDRLNSLIHRRIGKHSATRESAPRLQVGFPYLAGTLDQYQVTRVVNEKMLSDLRMDFGKREDEIKDISVDEVFNKTTSKEDLSTVLKTREFLPKSLQLKGRLLKDTPRNVNSFDYGDSPLIKSLQQSESIPLDITVKDIYPLPALVAQYKCAEPSTSFGETLGDNLKTKWEFKNTGRKRSWIESYEVLLPLTLTEQEMSAALGALKAQEPMLEPTPVFSLPVAKGFVFNRHLNTLAIMVTHEAPFKQTAERTQMVILEHLGDLLLVRSPIVAIEDLELSDKNLAIWIAEQNNQRDWGYLNDHDGVIWYCCIVAHPEKFGDKFDDITRSISKTADRLQQLYTAQDQENWDYKVNSSFSQVTRGAITNDQIISTIRDDKSYRSGISCWHQNIFNLVTTQLANELDIDEDVALNNIIRNEELLRNGTIRFSMPQKPALRFRIQSFLDMTNNKINGINLGEPAVIWQLAISTAKNGRSPQLVMDDYSELPHIEEDSDWLEVDAANNVKIYTCQDDEKKIRWFVIYHPASMLDGRNELFVNAWVNVVWRMRENAYKFMKQACAKDFEQFST